MVKGLALSVEELMSAYEESLEMIADMPASLMAKGAACFDELISEQPGFLRLIFEMQNSTGKLMNTDKDKAAMMTAFVLLITKAEEEGTFLNEEECKERLERGDDYTRLDKFPVDSSKLN